MKLRIVSNAGKVKDWECDEILRTGNWLILIKEEVESELAPIPKKKEIASFCNPATVVMLEED